MNSALCKKDVKTHPFMCLIENEIYSKSLIDHDLYRRQEYPKCFEISHFICASKVFEIQNLNNQLFNDKTGFYKICDKIDVDQQTDLNKWRKKQ